MFLSHKEVIGNYVGDADLSRIMFPMAYLADDVAASKALLERLMESVQARLNTSPGPTPEDCALNAAIGTALAFIDAVVRFQKSPEPVFRLNALGRDLYIGLGWVEHRPDMLSVRQCGDGKEITAHVSLMEPLNAAARLMMDQIKTTAAADSAVR